MRQHGEEIVLALVPAAEHRVELSLLGAQGRRQHYARAPFRVLDLRDRRARDLYEADLILLRPDMHVAWRGNRAPEDPARVASVATGHDAGAQPASR